MNSETKNIVIVAGFLAVIVAIVGVLWYVSLPARARENLVPFAQCLSDKHASMYGAYWCAHCKNQKELFGDAFEKISYVECTESMDECKVKGIEVLPTWFVFDGDGKEKKLEGEQTLEALSRESGCVLPIDNK